MYTFVTIKNTRISSLCKPLEIQNNNNFFLCKLLRAVTAWNEELRLLAQIFICFAYMLFANVVK
jgi:hypothetical protein